MIISPRNKVLFVHIQKNGGTSIQSLLHHNLAGCRVWKGHHSSVSRAIEILGMARLRKYYIFAFVRNPWDRLVSWWAMVQQTKQGRVSVRNAMVDVPFIDFIGEHIDTKPHRIIAATQLSYLTNRRGRLVVPNIFRFESFASECDRLREDLGLPAVRLPHRNPSDHRHYSTYYTAETRGIVSRRFAEDIETFGYTFEVP